MGEAKKNPLSFYKKARADFVNRLETGFRVVYGSGEIITTHSKQFYCSALFTKLCQTCNSMLALCPDPTNEDFEYSRIDLSSTAALARVVMDTFIAWYHFGYEDCPEDEFRTRQLLLFWRDFRVRTKAFAPFEPESIVEYSEFHTDDLKKRLSENEFWMSLPERRRNHLLNKNNALHSPDEVLRRADFDPEECRAIYSYWSAHTHCDSVSFIRAGKDGRGQGFVNDADISGIATCLHISGEFLSYATTRNDEFFKGAISRANAVRGFEPFEIVIPPRPWAGTPFDQL